MRLKIVGQPLSWIWWVGGWVGVLGDCLVQSNNWFIMNSQIRLEQEIICMKVHPLWLLCVHDLPVLKKISNFRIGSWREIGTESIKYFDTNSDHLMALKQTDHT
jgi:hypothetical protein